MGGNIALLFSGQLRCHKKIVNRWVKNFLNPLVDKGYTVNIFFETSEDENSLKINDIINEYGRFNVKYRITNDIDFREKVPNIFNLPTAGLSRGGHNQLIKEFYAMDRVFELMVSEGKKYDYIFRTRPDVIPLKCFDIDLGLITEKKFFYISNHDHHSGLNARFTLSDYETGKMVYSILENMVKINIDTLKNFGGENYWKAHLNSLNINYSLLDFKVGLVRDYDPIFPSCEWGKISCDQVIIETFNKNVLTI
jgi:hypothetical protein